MDDLPLKITVATVTFNADKLLERTIHSVESQAYPHVEHLIIDGNSQDDTLEEIHRYQERNSTAAVRHEINALSEPDKGLYDAMNKAIQMATGTYICFLNAGDKFHDENVLAQIAQTAKKGNKPFPGVIYGHTDIVDENGKFVRHRRLAPPNRLTWKSFKKGMVVCHQSFFARTDLARVTPYNLHYRFSADFDWCIRLMRKATIQKLPLKNAHLIVTDYLQADSAVTSKNHNASLLERFRIMARHYGLLTTVALHGSFVLRSIYKK